VELSALGRLRAGLAQLVAVRVKIEKLEGVVDKGGGLRALANRAALRVRPNVITMLLGNYRGSGLKVVTGQMQNAIANSRVDVAWKGSERRPSGAKLRIAMNVEEAATEDTPAKLATRSGALHSGAVYVPRVKRTIIDLPTGEKRQGFSPLIGARAKVTLKRALSKAAVDEQGLGWLGRRGLARELFRDKGNKWKFGKITVIKPRPYFYLTSAQEEAVMELFTLAVMEEFEKADQATTS